VAISEAQRADLYTGLVGVLGPERAELLMSQLPRFDPDQVATKSDLAELKAEVKAELAAVNQRLDRLFLALLAGSFGIVISLIGLIISGG
jgi:hypothetical protein